MDTLKQNLDLKLIRICGYADSMRKKTDPMALPLKRSQAVRECLIHMGIDPGRLEIKGQGATEPFANH